MRDELYIRGIKVDLGKTNIDLNYKSNLLSDISKIVSNNSYTIKLPKTAKNLSLIECSHIPSSVSRFPYLKHAGTLIRDGIEIVKDANVVLLETNESIEIALSWGNVINFANIINDGKKLTDLSHGTTENVDWAVWRNYGKTSSVFPRVNYGFNEGDENVWYHPVMRVIDIINKIQSDNGVIFNIPLNKILDMNNMIIPLLTVNDSQELYDKYQLPINFIGYNNIGGSVAYLKMSFAGDSTQINYGSITGFYQDNFTFNWSSKIKITGTLSITINTTINPFERILNINTKKNDSLGNSIISNTISKKPVASYVEGGKIRLDYEFNDFTDVEEEGFIDFVYQNNDIYSVNKSSFNILFDARGEVLFGEKFPFVPNLPDIKQIDFIKAITSMLGLFAIPGENNTIKFIPFDSLKDNVSKAVDWTSKVVKAYRDSVPRSMKYAVDNTAQNNRFLYKEDDSVKGNYDGNLKIEDSTLDFERDAIKLPFSACDTNAGVASIPMYSYNDKGELQYKKVNPRLLLEKLENINDSSGNVLGVFEGLEWETLLNNNYSTYKGLINNAKVITEYIRLNSIELRDLDMDVPVYLGQYGCYLAIIEIKTKENDICECKLLKLEI